MSYTTLTEVRDEADRLIQDQCAEDEAASGRCDAAFGVEIPPGPLHPAYVDALVEGIRDRLNNPNRQETMSLRWLSFALMSGGYDAEEPF